MCKLMPDSDEVGGATAADSQSNLFTWCAAYTLYRIVHTYFLGRSLTAGKREWLGGRAHEKARKNV